MYDDILTLKVSEEIQVVGFANDVAILVRVQSLADVKLYANEAVRTITNLLDSVNLNLEKKKMKWS